MKEQNFSNHSRYVVLYHFITPLIMVALLAGAVVNLFKVPRESMLSATLILLVAIALLPIWAYLRIFALRAQDRAIRAEENLRYFAITGQPLPSTIGLQQTIALRFAPDDELPSLALRVVSERLSPKEIKQAIRNWKADHHRA